MYLSKAVAGLVAMAILLTGCGAAVFVHGASASSVSSAMAGSPSDGHIKPLSGQVVRLSGKQVGNVLTQGYKVPIYWSTGLGINNIGYYSAEFSPIGAWRGTNGSAISPLVANNTNAAELPAKALPFDLWVKTGFSPVQIAKDVFFQNPNPGYFYSGKKEGSATYFGGLWTASKANPNEAWYIGNSQYRALHLSVIGVTANRKLLVKIETPPVTEKLEVSSGNHLIHPLGHQVDYHVYSIRVGAWYHFAVYSMGGPILPISIKVSLPVAITPLQLPEHRFVSYSRGVDKLVTDFVNKSIGFRFVGLGGTMGSEVALFYRSLNGGRSWDVISTTTTPSVSIWRPPHAPHSIPLEGLKTGIGFRDQYTGWMTGFTYQNGFAWLYVTHDSGRTWSHQSLDIPKGLQGQQMLLTPPTFFSDTCGILPVRFETYPSIVDRLYITHDGGKEWSAFGLVGTSGPLSWRLTNQFNGSVSYDHTTFTTRDSGYTWK